MFDRYSSRNNQKKLIQRMNSSPDKQNIDHKNCITSQAIQKSTPSKVRIQDFQILKESAISALIEKQEIIQSLTSCHYDELLSEIEQLTSDIKQLETQNYELKIALQDAVKTLHEERHQWNQQHFKLIEEIEYLKGTLTGIEASAEQTLHKNGELIVENEQIWQQMNKLQTAYKVAQEKLLLEFEEKSNKKQSLSRQKSSNQSQQRVKGVKFATKIGQSHEKVLFDNISEKSLPEEKQRQERQEQSIRNVLTYQTEDWLDQQSIENSIHEKHCLGRSIKAINLIDNYSVSSKNNPISDIQSQFTSRYFRYTNQNHLATIEKTIQDSCQHIPEVPEQEMFASQHHLQKKMEDNQYSMSGWWERMLYLATGVCAGALIVLKWTK